MFTLLDHIPTSTSLLMQCGYRSKVCTNHRATKLDGTLHKLCEFHRRKANLNQQRLHKRQREQRAARQMYGELAEDRPFKKTRPSLDSFIDPMFCIKQEFTTDGSSDYLPFSAGVSTQSKIGSRDSDFLEQLLLDMQSLPPMETFIPNASAFTDDGNSIIV